MKVCAPEMHEFDSSSMGWSRMKTYAPSNPVVGRKNFAMSMCGNQIFITGGMDNGQNPLSEFLILNPKTGNWYDMKQTRKKEKKNRLAR